MRGRGAAGVRRAGGRRWSRGVRAREDGADTVRWWGARTGLGGPRWVLGMGIFPPERRGGCPWHRAQLVVAGAAGAGGGPWSSTSALPTPSQDGLAKVSRTGWGGGGLFLPGIPGGCSEE